MKLTQPQLRLLREIVKGGVIGHWPTYGMDTFSMTRQGQSGWVPGLRSTFDKLHSLGLVTGSRANPKIEATDLGIKVALESEDAPEPLIRYRMDRFSSKPKLETLQIEKETEHSYWVNGSRFAKDGWACQIYETKHAAVQVRIDNVVRNVASIEKNLVSEKETLASLLAFRDSLGEEP